MTPAPPADAQPVAWMVTKEGEPMSPCLRTWEGEHAPGWTYTPLYAHPPAAPAQDAPADAISSHPDLCRDDNERNCPNSANLSAPADAQPEVVQQRWPFQRSPGAVAAEVSHALAYFNGDMIAALRCVFIEQGEALAPRADTAAPAQDVGELAKATVRLRDFITCYLSGQCKMLSCGDACACAMCDFDRLRAALDAANARAEAMQREPTEAMERAAVAAMISARCTDQKHEQYRLYVRKIWRAMFDAAKGTTP